MRAVWLTDRRLRTGKGRAFPWKNLSMYEGDMRMEKETPGLGSNSNTALSSFPVGYFGFENYNLLTWQCICSCWVWDPNLKFYHSWLLRISDCGCQNISVMRRYQRKCLKGIHPPMTDITKACICISKMPLKTAKSIVTIVSLTQYEYVFVCSVMLAETYSSHLFLHILVWVKAIPFPVIGIS